MGKKQNLPAWYKPTGCHEIDSFVEFANEALFSGSIESEGKRDRIRQQFNAHAEALAGRRDSAEREVKRVKETNARAYRERNALAVAFARLAHHIGWEAGVSYHDPNQNNGVEDWAIAMVNLPDGKQVSWHLSDDSRDALIGSSMPKFEGKWDGTYIARDNIGTAWVFSVPSERFAKDVRLPYIGHSLVDNIVQATHMVVIGDEAATPDAIDNLRKAMRGAVVQLEAGDDKRLVKFCPECGNVGEVEPPALACCPDHHSARLVPQEIANKMRDIFLDANRLREELASIGAGGVSAQRISGNGDIEARYRFLLAMLIERGVLTNKRYSDGVWTLQGIYGTDDSGLRGAGTSPEAAIDNAITLANATRHSPQWAEAWSKANADARQNAPCDDAIVERNVQMLRSRSRVGVAKYGVTLEGSNLSREQLLQHGLEEALDLANYLQGALSAIPKPSPMLDPTNLPKIHANFICESDGLMGETEAPIKNVSMNDDGSITVRIAHWPEDARKGAIDEFLGVYDGIVRFGRCTLYGPKEDVQLLSACMPDAERDNAMTLDTVQFDVMRQLIMRICHHPKHGNAELARNMIAQVAGKRMKVMDFAKEFGIVGMAKLCAVAMETLEVWYREEKGGN